MPCDKSLNVDLLGRIESVECRVVAYSGRTTEAGGHPVPIDLEPYADLRVGVLESLTVASVYCRVSKDPVCIAEGLIAGVRTPTVHPLVFGSALVAERSILDNRVWRQRDSMDLDEGR